MESGRKIFDSAQLCGADRKSPDVKKRCNFREEGGDCGYSDSHEGQGFY